MSEQFNQVSRHTGIPVVAGVLNIVIGSICVLSALIVGLVALFMIPAIGSVVGSTIPFYAGFSILAISILVIVLGALSITGGIYSLQRRMWGWALVGSIAATLISAVFGIVSIILTAISKNEYAK